MFGTMDVVIKEKWIEKPTGLGNGWYKINYSKVIGSIGKFLTF